MSWLGKAHLYAVAATLGTKYSRRLSWWQHGVVGKARLDQVITALPARAIGASSHAVAEAQRRLRPVRDTFVVYPGVDPTESAPRSQVRTELDLPEDALVVGMVARLQRLKGQHRLLEAVARLSDAFPTLHVVFIGGDAYGLDPHYGPALREEAKRSGIEDRTRFLGQVPNPLYYLSALDVLVNVSNNEALSLALLEAMSAGLPVIAVADGGGPKELVVNDQSGVLIHEASADALTPALARVLASAALRATLGDGAKRRYAEAFTPGHMSRAFEDAVWRVISAG
jgi:glycosyltransferase involved in cell wall biosynthesis